MPEPTPEAWAQIRHAYEHTDRPIEDICAEHGITSPTLRYRKKRWNWHARRPPIPREGPSPVDLPVIPRRDPEARSRASSDALWAASPESIIPAAAYGFRARRYAASRNDGEKDDPSSPMAAQPDHLTPPLPGESEDAQAEPASIVPRLQSAVARVLPAIEATIARLAAGSHHPRETEHAGRTLSSLTRTLRELNALLSEHLARPTAPQDDDLPKDMDAFRNELARRIDAFVASRTQDDGEAKLEET